MKIEKSTGCSTEVTGVSCIRNGASCKLSWRAASGGIIICYSSAFSDWPDKSIFESLTPAQESNLFSGSDLTLGKDTVLVYKPEARVQAMGAALNFEARARFSAPLKIQIFSVSADCSTVYLPEGADNRTILPANLKLNIEPAPFLKKGKKLTLSGDNCGKFPDGFLCYTIQGAHNYSNGYPMEYPIPNNKLTPTYLLPLDSDFNVSVAHKWKELVNLEVIK